MAEMAETSCNGPVAWRLCPPNCHKITQVQCRHYIQHVFEHQLGIHQ